MYDTTPAELQLLSQRKNKSKKSVVAAEGSSKVESDSIESGNDYWSEMRVLFLFCLSGEQ